MAVARSGAEGELRRCADARPADTEHSAPSTQHLMRGAQHSALTSQQLIESCQGLVKALAWKIHRKLPPQVDMDDLVAYGQLGLAQAAREYDASRGGQFTTYAYYRVRGAIFDGLSQMSWFSRRDYHASKYERLAADVMELEGREAPESVCRSAAEDVNWLAGVTGKLSVVYLASTEEEQSAGAAALVDRSDPPQHAMERELRVRLRELVDALPPEAGTLIKATYFEGVTLAEAARRLGISKAWASRLHARTLERLARALQLLGAA
jgi:RNA polymerase sigma factor FliA